MIIDSSAVLAVLLGEDDGPFYAYAITEAVDPELPAVSVLELTLVVEARKREMGLALLDRFLRASRDRVVPFGLEQLQIAKEAW
jgi:ribonuclease VapC